MSVPGEQCFIGLQIFPWIFGIFRGFSLFIIDLDGRQLRIEMEGGRGTPSTPFSVLMNLKRREHVAKKKIKRSVRNFFFGVKHTVNINLQAVM